MKLDVEGQATTALSHPISDCYINLEIVQSTLKKLNLFISIFSSEESSTLQLSSEIVKC